MIYFRVLAFLFVFVLSTSTQAFELVEASAEEQLLVTGSWVPMEQKPNPIMSLCGKAEDNRARNREEDDVRWSALIRKQWEQNRCAFYPGVRVRALEFLGTVRWHNMLLCELKAELDEENGLTRSGYGFWIIESKVLLKHCEKGVM